MQKRMVLTLVMALSIIAGIALLSGCTARPAEEVDVNQVRAYADPITENILSSLNDNDYARYSEHFDDAMKKALPEATFQQQNNLIKAKIGEYVSREFWKIETTNEYTIVYYKAKFTEEPDDVIVRVVFKETDGERFVSGLWFDSPKLRK